MYIKVIMRVLNRVTIRIGEGNYMEKHMKKIEI